MLPGYYTPAELAQMRGGGESTWRLRASRGDFIHAEKRGNTWYIPLRDVDHWGRGYDKEFGEPQKLTPEIPTDPRDIVLAQNDDGRYGIYVLEEWYGAGEALAMLDYLRKHEEWLKEKAAENKRNRENEQ
jgi:hypothetical protein